ncbi:MAG TPA: acyl carrier protein [Streptosporangiaceae bacterium]
MAAALTRAVGGGPLPTARISAATRLEGDLCLDSLDLTALAAVLRDRYGTAVDLVGYVAGLEIDEIIGLSVGDVTRYVNQCRQGQRRAERPAEHPR